MRVLATTSRVVTTATTSLTTASLPAHCQTPGGTLHRFDPAAQISAKSYRKRKAAVSCEIPPRTRSVARKPPRRRRWIIWTRTGPGTSIHPPNEQTPRSREPGGLVSHHPIHTEVGGFVRLPGLSGPRFQARQLRATQQPGEPVKLARVPAGTARRLPLWSSFAFVLRQSGAFAGRPKQTRDRSLTR